MSATYELRRIKNSKDSVLTKALGIYSQNIDPLLRTDTREIIYWLDNYNNSYRDKFFLLGLHLNGQLIGYAQIAYFTEEKIVFIDYIVIEQGRRGNNTFYEFVDQIKEYLFKENIEYNYVVGEVGYFDDKNEPTEYTRTLIRLLKMAGFGVLKTKYIQPMLGKNNYESEVLSVLMIYTSTGVKKIKKETFLLIIQTIYYNHYKRWYDRFFTEKEQSEYNTHLNELFDKLSADIRKKEYIEINGYLHLYSPTKGSSLLSSQTSKLAKLLTIIIAFAILAVILGVLILYLKKRFGLNEQTISLIAVCTTIVLIILVRFFYTNKNASFSEAIESTLKIFK